MDEWLTDGGKHPLKNDCLEYIEITDSDIRCALTSLNISMALKIVVKLLYLARKAKKKLAEKKQTRR
jgi:[calcium/calmodulin-dependent protein kinase] kinase